MSWARVASGEVRVPPLQPLLPGLLLHCLLSWQRARLVALFGAHNSIRAVQQKTGRLHYLRCIQSQEAMLHSMLYFTFALKLALLHICSIACSTSHLLHCVLYYTSASEHALLDIYFRTCSTSHMLHRMLYFAYASWHALLHICFMFSLGQESFKKVLKA
jgi:hypothetical protein